MLSKSLCTFLLVGLLGGPPAWGDGVAAGGQPTVAANPAGADDVARQFTLPTPAQYTSHAKWKCAKAYKETLAAGTKSSTTIDVESVVNRALANGLPASDEASLRRALNYLIYNPGKIPHQKSVFVMDYSMPGSEKRLFKVDTSSGAIHAYHGGQGWGFNWSRQSDNRVVNSFANGHSWLSAKGCMLSSSNYELSGLGVFYRLHGLTAGSNDADCNRDIGVHVTNHPHDHGHSEGCLSIDAADRQDLLAALGGGSIICSNPF